MSTATALHRQVTIVWLNEAQFVEFKMREQQQQGAGTTTATEGIMVYRLKYLFNPQYDLCRVDGLDRRVNHLGEKEIMISY